MSQHKPFLANVSFNHLRNDVQKSKPLNQARREFLKTGGLLVSLPLLAACGDGGNNASSSQDKPIALTRALSDSSVKFIGGSIAQQNLIKQALQQASDLTSAAKSVTNQGMFTAWFGSASTPTITQRVTEISNFIDSVEWTFDLTKLSQFQYENDLVFSVISSEGTTKVSVAPWIGLFQQTQLAIAVAIGAKSLVHLATTVRQSWTDLAFVNDSDATKELAKISPDLAIISPRNYMEFVTYRPR
jgi:hypothetical protein